MLWEALLDTMGIGVGTCMIVRAWRRKRKKALLHDALACQRLEKETELARHMKSLLIPKGKLALPRLQARTVYLPVKYVGGDYIDFLRIDERYTCFVVADVCGHGLPASLLAAAIRVAIRAVIQNSRSPDEIVFRLNQLLYEDLSANRSFVTMLVLVYDAVEDKLMISRAGHPQPLYLSATRQTVLHCRGGVGLGMMPDSSYPLEELDLSESCLLLVYTDGLLDMDRNEDCTDPQKWLSELSTVVNDRNPAGGEQIDRVQAYIREKMLDGQQTDDISVLILQFQSHRMDDEQTAGGLRQMGNCT